MTRNAWHWTSEIASSLSLESFQQNLDLLYQGFFKVVIQERDWGKLNTEVPALSFQGYTGKDSGRLRCQMGLEDQEGKEEERNLLFCPRGLSLSLKVWEQRKAGSHLCVLSSSLPSWSSRPIWHLNLPVKLRDSSQVLHICCINKFIHLISSKTFFLNEK